MLEISPEHTFGVISPAFKGCEGFFALQFYAGTGCTFLENGLCRLHETDIQPLECRFCHHSRPNLGQKCHAALEKDWNTQAGRELVILWLKAAGLWHMRHVCQFKWLR